MASESTIVGKVPYKDIAVEYKIYRCRAYTNCKNNQKTLDHDCMGRIEQPIERGRVKRFARSEDHGQSGKAGGLHHFTGQEVE